MKIGKIRLRYHRIKFDNEIIEKELISVRNLLVSVTGYQSAGDICTLHMEEVYLKHAKYAYDSLYYKNFYGTYVIAPKLNFEFKYRVNTYAFLITTHDNLDVAFNLEKYEIKFKYKTKFKRKHLGSLSSVYIYLFKINGDL